MNQTLLIQSAVIVLLAPDIVLFVKVSVQVSVGVSKFPLPSTVTQFIVFIFIQDTRVSCFPTISEASSLSALSAEKLAFIFGSDTPVIVSDDMIGCIVLIL